MLSKDGGIGIRNHNGDPPVSRILIAKADPNRFVTQFTTVDVESVFGPQGGGKILDMVGKSGGRHGVPILIALEFTEGTKWL